MITRRNLIQAGSALLLARTGIACALAPLRVAYHENFSPLSFNQDGAVHGILIDIFDEVLGRRLAVGLDHGSYPWARAQLLVERGELDALCTIATPARLEFAVAAQESVVTAPTYIFVRADHPLFTKLKDVRSLEQLRQLNPTVLSYNGNGWAKANLSNFNVRWEFDYNSAQRMLIGGQGDIMVENSITMQYSLNKLPGKDDIRMIANDLDRVKFQLLIHKRSPHVDLVPAFDKAMRQFKQSAAYARIFNQYGVQI